MKSRTLLEVNRLEDRIALSTVELESWTVRDLCEEHDSAQVAHYAAAAFNGQLQRQDAFGNSFVYEALRPGYDPAGQTRPGAQFGDCPNSGEQSQEEQTVKTWTSPDKKWSLEARRKASFPAPTMTVVVGNVAVEAHYVALHTRITPMHYPSGFVVYGNSSTRAKFVDPSIEEEAKYNMSFFFGPETRADDLPNAPISRLDFNFGTLTFKLNYRNRPGDYGLIRVLEMSTDRTSVQYTIGFHTDANTPFGVLTSMIPATDLKVFPDRSDVQMIAYHNADGYHNQHILDFSQAHADAAYFYRSQRPERETNTGPDIIISFVPFRGYFFGNNVFELESDGDPFSERENASQDKARLLEAGGSMTVSVQVDATGWYALTLTYSHDFEDPVPPTLTATLNGEVFQFSVLDTGAGLDPGDGWDQWENTPFGGDDSGTRLVRLEKGVTYELFIQTEAKVEVDTAILVYTGTATTSDGPRPIIVTGASSGSPPWIRVFDGNGALRYIFLAYTESFRGGVRVAVGDVNGDQVPDVLAVPGPGIATRLKIFDGRTGRLLQAMLAGIFPYGTAYSGGAFVAAGNIYDSQPGDEIIVSPQSGSRPVKVYAGNGTRMLKFYPYGTGYTGGVQVAAGDVVGRPEAEIVTVRATSSSLVRIFNGRGRLLRQFTAFSGPGAFITVGNTDGIGKMEIIVGSGSSQGAKVKIFAGQEGILEAVFKAYGDDGAAIRVGAVDWDGDGRAEILTVPGRGSPKVKLFDGLTLKELDAFFAGGNFVAGLV